MVRSRWVPSSRQGDGDAADGVADAGGDGLAGAFGGGDAEGRGTCRRAGWRGVARPGAVRARRWRVAGGRGRLRCPRWRARRRARPGAAGRPAGRCGRGRARSAAAVVGGLGAGEVQGGQVGRGSVEQGGEVVQSLGVAQEGRLLPGSWPATCRRRGAAGGGRRWRSRSALMRPRPTEGGQRLLGLGLPGAGAEPPVDLAGLGSATAGPVRAGRGRRRGARPGGHGRP